MWQSPLYLELATREKMRELDRAAESALSATRLKPVRPGCLRRSLARRLVSLGHHLDPHADGQAQPNGRPRLASR
jgi:hypothetical protein